MEAYTGLGPYVDVLRRRKVAIITVGAIVTLCASAFSFLLPPVYEAKAIILVATPAIAVGAPPDPAGGGVKIGTVLPEDISLGNVVALATLPSVTQRLASMVGERRLSERLSARPIPQSNFIELAVRGRHPRRVANIANLWASVLEADNLRLVSTGNLHSYTFLDEQTNAARQRLQAADEAVRNFNAMSTIGVLQARINAVTSQIASYESRLTDLSVSLQGSNTALGQITSQLDSQPQFLTLSRSITTDPFVLQAASQAERRDFVELSKLDLRDQQMNPLYARLAQERADTSIQIATMRAQYARTLQAIDDLKGDLAQLHARLAQQQYLYSQITRSQTDVKQIYDVLVQRRDEARVASADGAMGTATVVSQAVVPDQPVGPHKVVNVMLAALLGPDLRKLPDYGAQTFRGA